MARQVCPAFTGLQLARRIGLAVIENPLMDKELVTNKYYVFGDGHLGS